MSVERLENTANLCEMTSATSVSSGARNVYPPRVRTGF